MESLSAVGLELNLTLTPTGQSMLVLASGQRQLRALREGPRAPPLIFEFTCLFGLVDLAI